MIRTILKSNKNSLTLELPDDMVGKMIEVIAFEIDQISPAKKPQDLEKSKRIKAIDKALNNTAQICRVLNLTETKPMIMSEIAVDTNVLIYLH